MRNDRRPFRQLPPPPGAPAVYRPPQTKPTPPPVFRSAARTAIQSRPAVLQRKMPAVPPVFRPGARTAIQPKPAALQRKTPVLPPAFRPGARAMQPKPAALPRAIPATPAVPQVYGPAAARGGTHIIQRAVAADARPGTAVIVTNPIYKMKYRTVGQVVRRSQLDGHLIVKFDGMTPEGADGFRFGLDDLDYAPSHNAISVVASGPTTFILVGTSHGRQGQDLSRELNPALLSGSSIVLEYPPLPGIDQSSLKDLIPPNKINDNTQQSLAALAPKQGATIIGADARKAFVSGRLHGISLKNKEAKDFKMMTSRMIARHEIEGIATAYAAAGRRGDDVGTVVAQISELVVYRDGTDLRAVLSQACARLHELFLELGQAKTTAIIFSVMRQLGRDLDPIEKTYLEDKPKYESSQFPLETLYEISNDDSIAALYLAISNFQLLAETLAARSRKVVVAFGAEHIRPIQDVLASLNS